MTILSSILAVGIFTGLVFFGVHSIGWMANFFNEKRRQIFEGQLFQPLGYVVVIGMSMLATAVIRLTQ